MGKYVLYISLPGGGKSTYIRDHFGTDDFIRIAPSNAQCDNINGQTIYHLTKSRLNLLACNGTVFTKPLIIDEVFLYTLQDMKVIVECIGDQDVYMFGDPF